MLILNTGYYLPERVEHNDYFVSKLGLATTEEWISKKTGIISRHYVFPNQKTSDLATEAARMALTGYDPKSVDLIIVATTTPDMEIPSTATFVQRNIGANCPAVDINNACSGFIYALDMAHHYIQSTYKRVLVIGADAASRVTNFGDRLTAPFFADGAGAMLVEKSAMNLVLSRYLASEGNYEAISTVDTGKLTMDGKAIWEFAHRAVPETLQNLVDQINSNISDIDLIIPHQANGVMLESICDKMNIPRSKMFIDIENVGNTISATIPIAFHRAVNQKRIKFNDTVALVGYGAGLSWGGILLRY